MNDQIAALCEAHCVLQQTAALLAFRMCYYVYMGYEPLFDLFSRAGEPVAVSRSNC